MKKTFSRARFGDVSISKNKKLQETVTGMIVVVFFSFKCFSVSSLSQ